jgi:hypothetical protein
MTRRPTPELANRGRWQRPRAFAPFLVAVALALAGYGAVGATLASAVGPTACMVNTVTDEHNAGSGTCDSTLGVGRVSLRSAIEAFNTSSNTGTITFNVPAASVITLANGELALTNGTVTITGPGARSLAIDGNAQTRVFHVGNHGGTPAVTATISGLTIRNGKTPTASYPSYSGGGVYNDTGTLTMDQVTITSNAASWGAAIDQEGVLHLTNSTLNNNSISGSHCGGAAMETESDVEGASTTFVNVTITGNDSGTCDQGGTIAAFGGTDTFTNVTISGNEGVGGAVHGGAVTVSNSILANQTGSNVCTASPVDNGSNLSSDASCGFAVGTPKFDLVSTDPMLSPLANNGGPTDTMALQSGSPAIDAVQGTCPLPATDQRGVTRPVGPKCDIGAFEFSAAAVIQVTASCGPAAGGGTIAIIGTGLLGATAVTIGGKPATSFTVVSDSLINAVAPAGTAGGSVDIIVTTPSGTSATTTADRCAYQTAAVAVTPALPKAGAQSRRGATAPWGELALACVLLLGVVSGCFTIVRSRWPDS